MTEINYHHVYPIDDLKEHVLHGSKCWCKPKVDLDLDIITHNSMDERESFETGERKPS